MMKCKKANKTALVCAVDMLAVRSYSQAMLSDRLRCKGFPEEDITMAIERLLYRGYLDDATLCVHMYNRLLKEEKYSLKQITYKLLQKGFAETMIRKCFQEDDFNSEKLAAVRVLRSKYRVPDIAERGVMMRYLYSKGFCRQSINKAVEVLFGEVDISVDYYPDLLDME